MQASLREMLTNPTRFALPARIQDNDAGFEYLCGVANKLKESWRGVIDFTHCAFLMQNGLAVLGGLACLAADLGGSLEFEWSTLQRPVRQMLARNNFMHFFSGSHSLPIHAKTAVPFRRDTTPDQVSLIRYLSEGWVTGARVKLSEPLKHQIVGKTWEIYANAFEHGKSRSGVFSCGQHYPQKQELKLTVVDFGIGIPMNVRRHTKRPHMSGAEALDWAFKRGNSSNAEKVGIARGLGLDLLRSFVKVNRGSIEILSYDGYARASEDINFRTSRFTFPGTIVNITFSCDESYYRLASEIDSSRPLF
jgi:hypothetical protein